MPNTGPRRLTAVTVRMADAVATAAIERSNTPAMMQMVVVAAKINRMDDWSRMLAAFVKEKNDRDATASSRARVPKTATIP
jgi:hypothetical protein